MPTIEIASAPSPRSNRAQSSASKSQVELVSVDEICGALGDRWAELRYSDSRFASPYFDLEFLRAANRVRDDIEVAVIENRTPDGDRSVIGFLPFQRINRRHAVPVGGRLNDVHGILGSSLNNSESLGRVVSSAKLNSYAFHAAIRDRESARDVDFETVDSHHIDLSPGFENYLTWVRRNSSTVKRHGQKARALEREVGPLRLEFDCSNPELLEKLIKLKRSKYQRTKTFDILSVEWARNLLREISVVDQANFKGLLSVLWAGDELVACHFGMLTNGILHYWFPTFDNRFKKYSPGTELILRVAREAHTRDVRKIDFGYGDDSYKFKFCNGRESLSCGRVASTRIGFQFAKGRYFIRKKLKSIPLKPLAKTVLRRFYPGFGGWNFQ